MLLNEFFSNLDWTHCFPCSFIPYCNASLDLFYPRLIPTFTNIFFFLAQLINISSNSLKNIHIFSVI